MSTAFQFQSSSQKQFPKISYTKIHNISYNKPIFIRRKRPYTFVMIKKIGDYFTNYIDEVYAMGSYPLSYNFSNELDKIKKNEIKKNEIKKNEIKKNEIKKNEIKKNKMSYI